jgi:4-amino-4-deoxy-L-arabinose transferase-like glycosyltransferase
MTVESSSVSRARKGFIGWSGLHYVALGLICLVPVLLYLPMLTTPFNGDEGFYATVARMMLHGGIPYRDAFDNKPPLIFGWYAISFLLFGETVWAPRLLVALLLSLTTSLVYVEARLVFSRGAGLIAAGAFALSVGIVKFETDAQTEYFMLLPMVGGLVAFTLAARGNDMRWYLLAGVLNGLAIVTRQTAAFPFAAILWYAAFVHPTEQTAGRAAVARPILAMLSGAAAVGIATFLPFLLTGTAADFWDALFVYGWTYSEAVPVYAKVVNGALVVPPLILVAGPFILLAALGVAYTLRDARRSTVVLLVAWLAANVLGIVSVGRYYHHQFAQLLPALALLAPGGVMFLRNRWRRFPVRLSAYIVFSLIVPLSAVLNGQVYLKPNPSARHIAVYPTDLLTQWQVRSEALGNYIRSHTTETDTIYNIGFQAELYFYADRRPASRYAFDHLFITDNTLERKALADLELHPPLLIIDSAANEIDPYGTPLIREFLQTNYDFVGKVEYADIYELRSSSR